ncbi:hypothetical protein GQ44DRAFT_666999 [Phaeosphaeriaceae sp. PMI808]|nr:hypothetical protein GQ44DRAFT_666999 [Phaeosphaeriaceae sp. PMI808]
MAMAAAAFLGISWYICVDLNVRLLFNTTRRGLYVWSCLLCSWGILVHTVSILLSNFNVWKGYSVVVFILISFAIYVTAQSFVLYSRLNLVLSRTVVTHYVLAMILVNSTIFGLGTAIFGMIAIHPSMAAKLGKPFLTWDKVQLAAFTVQETVISSIYIVETKRVLSHMAVLTDKHRTRCVLRHLIYINIFIICLDISLMGVCYAGFFFLQGYLKAAIYAIKVRMEFTILNQLRSALPSSSQRRSDLPSSSQRRSKFTRTHDGRSIRGEQHARSRGSQGSDVEIIEMIEPSARNGGIRVQKGVEVFSMRGSGQ